MISFFCILFGWVLFSTNAYSSLEAPNKCLLSLAGEPQLDLYKIGYENRLEFNSKINPVKLKTLAFLSDNSILNLSLKLKSEHKGHELRAEITGRNFIQNALKFFPQTKMIRGFWTSKANEGNNYKSFFEALRNGMSLEQAAFETHTGKLALENNFNKVHFLEVEKASEYSDGIVRVWFYKSSMQNEINLFNNLRLKLEEANGSDINFEITADNHPYIYDQIRNIDNSNTFLSSEHLWKTVIGRELKLMAESYDYSNQFSFMTTSQQLEYKLSHKSKVTQKTDLEFTKLKTLSQNINGEAVYVRENKTVILNKKNPTHKKFNILYTKRLKSCIGIVFHDTINKTTMLSHFVTLKQQYVNINGIKDYVSDLKQRFIKNNGDFKDTEITLLWGESDRNTYMLRANNLIQSLKEIAPSALKLDLIKDTTQSNQDLNIYVDINSGEVYKTRGYEQANQLESFRTEDGRFVFMDQPTNQ